MRYIIFFIGLGLIQALGGEINWMGAAFCAIYALVYDFLDLLS